MSDSEASSALVPSTSTTATPSTSTSSINPSSGDTVWYADKGLWVTCLGFLLPFISKWVGITMDPAKVAEFVIPAVVYIIAHKAKSGAVLVAQIKADAQKVLGADPKASPTTADQAAAALNSLGK